MDREITEGSHSSSESTVDAYIWNLQTGEIRRASSPVVRGGVGCMPGTWLILPLIGLGVIVLAIIFTFPVLLIPLIGWRVLIAVRGYARG